MATPISGAAQKYFFRDVKGKLCSKFGDDRSKTGLTMLAVVAGWTGRTPDGGYNSVAGSTALSSFV